MVTRPRDAVVFSGYFPNQQSLIVLKMFLELWEGFYDDCDIFIGINPPGAAAVQLLESSKLRIKYATVEPRLVVDSDVSGYQAALGLLKSSGEKYRLVWFMHSKGASHFDEGPSNPSFSYLLKVVFRFLVHRHAITDEMNADPGCGTYSYDIGKDKPGASATSRNPHDVLGQFFRFDRPDFHRYFCVATLYAMKGFLVDDFVHQCNDSFFTGNIVSDCGADRYFFEQIFPNIAWRRGYRPRFRNWYGGPRFLEPENSFEEDWQAFVSPVADNER